MSKQWYILQIYSQFEGQVKRALMERIEREGLQDSFGQILIPSEEVVEIKDGKKRNSQRKFFPNYVLVEMEMNDATEPIDVEFQKIKFEMSVDVKYILE